MSANLAALDSQYDSTDVTLDLDENVDKDDAPAYRGSDPVREHEAGLTCAESSCLGSCSG